MIPTSDTPMPVVAHRHPTLLAAPTQRPKTGVDDFANATPKLRLSSLSAAMRVFDLGYIAQRYLRMSRQMHDDNPLFRAKRAAAGESNSCLIINACY